MLERQRLVSTIRVPHPRQAFPHKWPHLPALCVSAASLLLCARASEVHPDDFIRYSSPNEIAEIAQPAPLPHAMAIETRRLDATPFTVLAARLRAKMLADLEQSTRPSVRISVLALRPAAAQPSFNPETVPIRCPAIPPTSDAETLRHLTLNAWPKTLELKL